MKHGNPFVLERGIKQGNPNSPYMFINCPEYLGRYIYFMPLEKKIKEYDLK